MIQHQSHGNSPQCDSHHSAAASRQSAPYVHGGQPGSVQGELTARPGTGFGVKQILSTTVAFGVLGLVGCSVVQDSQIVEALEEGNCLVVTGDADDASYKTSDCDDESRLTYYVGEVIEDGGVCADESAIEFSVNAPSNRGSSEGGTQVACLVPQFFADTCYVETNDVMELAPGDCAEAAFKVTTVTDESGSECAEGEDPISFTVPARTYCIGYPE